MARSKESSHASRDRAGAERYGAGQEGGAEGSVKHATLSLKDQRFMCIDSNLQHDWTFMPAVALQVGSGPPGWSPGRMLVLAAVW
jgi:predicted 3-demethylubiquinone-9 3-methyltransferase (glyoxalase superfamily)